MNSRTCLKRSDVRIFEQLFEIICESTPPGTEIKSFNDCDVLNLKFIQVRPVTSVQNYRI